ncbi:uncharacterized protein THITE_2169219 [Thermothielavioides terrestris NRRL 8126]|uniref:Uncharacterized protein n=1 Tax=Thermothielavioides terrestris (strain ATCC 38088 / NRRL 8126) TaxID=578455 RepID=G2QRX4_THETT|nr:uncharacterized protein THITE_2169219 [Thermothielavioides terrestris NRRL 8126]AEO62561.1 hypothetical protein THITE_2169219 [Thermothielavioides terrestris NRRL 8126]
MCGRPAAPSSGNLGTSSLGVGVHPGRFSALYRSAPEGEEEADGTEEEQGGACSDG